MATSGASSVLPVLLPVLGFVGVPGLLLGLPLGLLAVEVVVVPALEVLLHLSGGEAGQQLLGELVVLGDALALAVVLEHSHGLEPGRAGQQLVGDLVPGPLVVIDVVVGALRAKHVEESHK